MGEVRKGETDVYLQHDMIVWYRLFLHSSVHTTCTSVIYPSFSHNPPPGRLVTVDCHCSLLSAWRSGWMLAAQEHNGTIVVLHFSLCYYPGADKAFHLHKLEWIRQFHVAPEVWVVITQPPLKVLKRSSVAMTLFLSDSTDARATTRTTKARLCSFVYIVWTPRINLDINV